MRFGGEAIGGALSGAGTGAALGSVVPGLGTALGAGVGALSGLLLGGLQGGANQRRENRDKAMAAMTSAFSPWTGMQPGGIRERDQWSSAIQGALSGAQMFGQSQLNQASRLAAADEAKRAVEMHNAQKNLLDQQSQMYNQMLNVPEVNYGPQTSAWQDMAMQGGYGPLSDKAALPAARQMQEQAIRQQVAQTPLGQVYMQTPWGDLSQPQGLPLAPRARGSRMASY